MDTKRCCNELDKLHNDFEKLVKSSLQANSTGICCKNLKKLRKYFNLILAEIGDDNVFNQNRITTTRIAKYFGNPNAKWVKVIKMKRIAKFLGLANSRAIATSKIKNIR